ncbi:MAG: polysaccharide deacetylase family protein [Fimbriimonadaceae bacterium]|nr:polysaccharide deacetylase family protein [Fimbriimonadaceae bacterium]
MSDPFRWPHGARAAVSLSYDDTMPCHRTLVAPALEAHGLRGTFYAPPRDDLMAHSAAWRAMAARGHELGNHTLFHPCRREVPQADDWLATWNNLIHFDAQRFRQELRVANFILQQIDGQTARTYGNTCHDVWIGPPDAKQRIEPILAELFVAGRGERTQQPTDPATCDLHNLGTSAGDGHTCDRWLEFIQAALDSGGYCLLTFHGVGPGYERLQVDDGEHTRLLTWLREQQERIWTAPVIQVAEWISERRADAVAGRRD